jgi:hypothetical protein
MNNENNNNPFTELSQLFIDNQRTFNSKCITLIERTGTLATKLLTVKKQLTDSSFDADLNLYLNIEEEARLILLVAKEVESQRDKIVNSINLMKKSNIIKLNK